MAVIEQVFKARSQQVHHKREVIAFFAAPVHLRCTQAVFKKLVQLGFVFDLRVLRLDLLKLDGEFFVSLLINAQ